MKIKKNIAISPSGLLFNPTSGESYSVNPIGLEILNLSNEGKGFEEICSALLKRYKTDRDTLEKDYSDFKNMLAQNNLLEEHEKEES